MALTKMPLKAMEAAARAAFTAAGFRRQSGIFTLDLGPNVYFRVGLNRGRAPEGVLVVYPGIGIHHVGLHRLNGELCGVGYQPSVSTLGLGLAELLPGRSGFLIPTEADVPRVVEEIVTATTQHGVPYMRPYTTLEAIVGALPTFRGLPLPSDREYYLPTGMYLLGRRDDALVALAAGEERRAGKDPFIRDHYANFAANLRERIRAS